MKNALILKRLLIFLQEQVQLPLLLQMKRSLQIEYTGEGGNKKNSADPFVIALAKQENCKVVTEEVPFRNSKSPQIPDVCNEYKIECIDFVHFAREVKFAF